MKIEIGKTYYWRDIKKVDHWGCAESLGKNGTVVLREASGEVWIVPEDELIEW